MVSLHAAVRLEHQCIAQLWVFFPDDRVERDLGIFGDAEVAQFARREPRFSGQKAIDREANEIGYRAFLLDSDPLKPSQTLRVKPDGPSIF
ncbi:hypothetical protein [Sphingomonas sp. CV7422]|uniref:hypothetical protein n=1 Tax=Sphingomonas sp. CV7422 TaxID=3018036 RepID=UPI0022FE3A89|nr:hypothetical protein [Sphingomonas sp. CV7422]